MLNKNPIIKGTIILTIASLLSRIIGFLYRIFLSNLIGAKGMGVFQLIFPVLVFCIALFIYYKKQKLYWAVEIRLFHYSTCHFSRLHNGLLFRFQKNFCSSLVRCCWADCKSYFTFYFMACMGWKRFFHYSYNCSLFYGYFWIVRGYFLFDCNIWWTFFCF